MVIGIDDGRYAAGGERDELRSRATLRRARLPGPYQQP